MCGALSPTFLDFPPCRQLELSPRGDGKPQESLAEALPKVALYLVVPKSSTSGWFRRADYTLTLLSEGGQDYVEGEGSGERYRGECKAFL